MSEWALHDDPAVVGRRIRQARRELGLTQADLATRVGVSLGALDRFETGKGDPSEKLEQIAEITGKPVSWYTSTDEYDVGDGTLDTGLPAELRRRLAESSRRTASVNGSVAAEQEPVEATAAPTTELREEPDAHGEHEPEAAAAAEHPRATALDEGPTPAPAPADLLDERTELVREQEALRATLAAEQREHATRATAMAAELERVNAKHQELMGVLEQSRAELATSRAREAELAERASELEGELQTARQQVAETTARLDQADTELERLRRDERANAEALDLRTAELRARAEALDAQEATVGIAQDDLGFRSTQLDAREAEMRFRSAQLDTREAELGLQSAQLDTREAELRLRSAQLDTREATLAAAEQPSAEHGRSEEAEAERAPEEAGLPTEEDVYLAVLPDRGYKLVARYGAAPEPGAIVELDDVRYRCVRVQRSPFFGDDRVCAVLELLRREPDASQSADVPAE